MRESSRELRAEDLESLRSASPHETSATDQESTPARRRALPWPNSGPNDTSGPIQRPLGTVAGSPNPLRMSAIVALRRRASPRAARPVTPEVAGSSPVAPAPFQAVTVGWCLARDGVGTSNWYTGAAARARPLARFALTPWLYRASRLRVRTQPSVRRERFPAARDRQQGHPTSARARATRGQSEAA